MNMEYKKIYPGVKNKIICAGCLRENEIVVDSSTGGGVTYACACATMTKLSVVNRRKSGRLLVDAFGTCWLDNNGRGMPVKITDLSDDGLGMNFIGLKKDVEPKLKSSTRGKVIYTKDSEIISSPREIIFKNIRGMHVGAQFCPMESASRGNASQQAPTPPREPPNSVKQLIARMKCPVCKHEIVEKVNCSASVEIHCPNCEKVFSIDTNRRKAPRTDVSFPGRVSDLTGEMYRIHVRNLSRQGICFRLLDTSTEAFNKKEHLIVNFNTPDETISGKAIIASFSGKKDVHAKFRPYG